MRSLSIAIREWLLDKIRKSKFVAKTYCYLVVFYCENMAIERNCYEALTLLCNAMRRVPDLSVTNKCSLLAEKIIQDKCCSDGTMLPIEQNGLLTDFRKSHRYSVARGVFADEPEIDRLHLRHYRQASNAARQGNIIILKAPGSEVGEKGVMLLKYSPTFEQFPAIFDIASVTKEYRLVFEPSWYRNVESSLFLYSGLGITNVLQAAQNDDKVILESVTSSIRTVDLGSGDWIDIDEFCPTTNAKIYDVVMVASWAKFKRHKVLFKSLFELKKLGKALRVALIGYPMDMTKDDILDQAKEYHVDTFCEIFEQIPPSEVARITSASRMAVHLSKAEGTNKASYEALLCDVPLIIYKHNIGFRNNYINASTGVMADDNELAGAIEYVLANADSFSPRKWIVKQSGHKNATHKLNQALKEIALENGEPWTVDIVLKKNGPNFLYARDDDRMDLESAYYDLKTHLHK